MARFGPGAWGAAAAAAALMVVATATTAKEIKMTMASSHPPIVPCNRIELYKLEPH